MSERTFFTGIIVATVGILIGGVFLSVRSGQKEWEGDENARVFVSETSHDWGTIGINNGTVEKTFTVTNEGTAPLKLSDVTTSCMCTTARLSLGETTSPEFNMHTQSSFVLDVPPKESAKLAVTFDPAFHGPSGVGPITRQIQVRTNDPQQAELSFTLTAEVIR